MSAPTARLITPDELVAWYEVPRVAMHGPPITAEQVESVRPYIHPERCIAAFDGTSSKPCGSAGSFPSELTVPGGKVATGAVTAVGVLPTHRRQGHLRRMMEAQLADILERGEPTAILVAAEYPIYGRFGYGPATQACAVRIDASNPSALWRDEPTGTTELLDNEMYTKLLIELYERVRHDVVGHMSYEDARWKVQSGEIPWPGDTDEAARKALKVAWRDQGGIVQAVASYTTKDHWTDNRPRGELNERMLVAATGEAEREMLRYFTAVDWMATIQIGTRPVDEPISLWLHDGRAAVTYDESDHVWARLLDVPTALAARRYATDGRVVFEVDDPLGYGQGRFALEGGPGGATCTPTGESADMRVPVSALGAAYLGGYTWARLADAGWVDEERPGAVDRASAMFATPRAPWCAMTF
jgi:predicted acetyltransferase